MQLLDKVKIKTPDQVGEKSGPGWESSRNPKEVVAPFARKVGVIVDYSDSHGLCYGVVFPNLEGSSGREDQLTLYWFDPDEIEATDEIPSQG